MYKQTDTPTALIFRGQPAQYAGMARAVAGLKEAEPVFSAVRAAAKSLGIDGNVLRLMSDDASQNDLSNSLFAHTAISAVNHILRKALESKAKQIGYPLGFKAVAGNSVGQMEAFEAAGAARFEEDILPVTLAGSHYLHEYSQKNKGGLTAVFFGKNGSPEQLEELKATLLNCYGDRQNIL